MLVLPGFRGTFTTVTAAIAVPDLFGDDGSFMAWIGLDSDYYTTQCASGALFRAGIGCTITNGNNACYCWYQWHPDVDGYTFSNIAINPNDTITVNLVADSRTSGHLYIQNQMNGQVVWEDITSSHVLCEANAAWKVSEALNTATGSSDRLANFGAIIFSSASASDSNGVLFLPDGSTYLLDVEQNKTKLTSTLAFGSTLLVQRL